MKTIETRAVVGEDRTITLQLPPEVSAGEHHVVLVIDDGAPAVSPRPPLRFTQYTSGPAVATMTFRRDDIYDDGR